MDACAGNVSFASPRCDARTDDAITLRPVQRRLPQRSQREGRPTRPMIQTTALRRRIELVVHEERRLSVAGVRASLDQQNEQAKASAQERRP